MKPILFQGETFFVPAYPIMLAVGTCVFLRLSTVTAELFGRGHDEIDIVRSGLEGTMVDAYREIRAVYKRRRQVKDLRTAAYVVAIEKVADAYESLGVWP